MLGRPSLDTCRAVLTQRGSGSIRLGDPRNVLDDGKLVSLTLRPISRR